MPRTYWQVLIKKTMEQTIIQSTQDVLKKKVNFFEQQQKEFYQSMQTIMAEGIKQILRGK